MSLIVVKPTTITPSMLVATDVLEADYAEWVISTVYSVNDRVIYNHVTYESLQNTNSYNAPDTNPLHWASVSATNRWKAFDLSNSTQTANPLSMYYEIATGRAVNAVALLNMASAKSVRIQLTDPSFGVVYDKTTQLASRPKESSWYAWFFGERTEEPQHVALDLPTYPNAVLRVDITGGDSLAIGVILIGQQRSIGMDVRSGLRMSIRDYSRKETNAWGDTTLVQRAYAKTRSVDVIIENNQLDNTDALLSSLRSTPLLWIPSNRIKSTNVFGFYNGFETMITYTNYSECSIDIEGLT